MNELDRTLPSSEEGERAVLGSVILNDKMYEVAAERLVEDDFYSPYHRRVWAAMTELFNASRPITPIAIVEVWKSEGVAPESIGGVSRVALLNDGSTFMGAREVRDMTKRIKEYSVARQLIRTSYTAMEDLLAGQVDINEVVQRAEGKILSLSTSLHVEDKGLEKPFSDIIEIIPDMRKQFEDYRDGVSNGVPTGMKEVDDKLDGGGLQDGALYVVAAGEKSGKTSLALDWASDISIIKKLGWTLIVTGEMSKVSMGKRLYSPYAQIPYWKFRPGMYDTPDDPTFSTAVGKLDRFGEAMISISDRLTSVGQISRHLRRRVEAGRKDPSKKVVLIIIDYLQLMELEDKKGMSRTEEVEKVSRAFKKLAMELGVPIIAISSLNRIGLTEGQVPDTFNLRQAGTIANDAEAIWFLHNPAYVPGQPYTPMEVTPMNLILARQRNGPTGTIPVMFIGPYMQFVTVGDYERLMGNRNNDNVIPRTKEGEAQDLEDQFKLWET